MPPKNRPSLDELLSAPEPIYKENQKSEEPLLTDEQLRTLKQCLDLYTDIIQTLNYTQGDPSADLSKESMRVHEVKVALSKILGANFC